jgi:hypothetical protein
MRRSRRVTRAVAGALAAAAMVVGALLLSGVFDGSRPPATAAPVVVQGTDPTSGVHAEVTLRARSTGTQVTLALRGVRPGEHCRLVVADGVGHREVAASWVASYEGAADVTGTTGLASARITRLSVVGTGGRTLVTMPVPAQ